MERAVASLICIRPKLPLETTRGLPPLSRLMIRRTRSSGRLLAAACRAIRPLRLPLASSRATRWFFAEATEAEAVSATKKVAMHILRIMSSPVFLGCPAFRWEHRQLCGPTGSTSADSVSYTHLRAHETVLDLVCRLLL